MSNEAAVWTEDGRGLLTDSGDYGGDTQAGDAWHRRFTRPASAPGEWDVLTVYVYQAQDSDGTDYIERMVEYMVCTDPADPGSTEVWSDSLYTSFDGEVSDARARELCAAFRPAGVDARDRWMD